MIWEQLLTDADGQYVEVQSGRLFNQAAEDSTLTPFKHRGFAPAATDTWTEYWMPVKGTKGLVKANDAGALNVRREAGMLSLDFMAVQALAGTLQVLDGERIVLERSISLTPMQVWRGSAPDVPDARLRVRVLTANGHVPFEYVADPSASVLSRPLEAPRDFDWDSVYGLYVKGKEHLRQRAYAAAAEALQACLSKDPHFAPALVDLAALKYRAMDYQGAYDLARRALAIDTYDGAANYHFGLAAEALGRTVDARDGFELATQSLEFRAAAWQRLARLALREGRFQDAATQARRAVDVNAEDVDARGVLAVAQRRSGDTAAARATVDAILAIDPLNHLAMFERATLDARAESRRAFVESIRNEMPRETFLELATWYSAANQLADADAVLGMAPESAEVLYWLAFLRQAMGKPGVEEVLARATAASPAMTFPFRQESVAVLRWASQSAPGWKPNYYLAILQLGLGNTQEASRLLEECGGQPDFAPFYAARAQVRQTVDPTGGLADLRKALALEPGQWRFPRLLAERLVSDGAYAEALEVATRAYGLAPSNYILGILVARTLSLNGRYRESAALLGRLKVLPYEGANDAQRLHREAHLMLAVDALKRGDRQSALREVAVARTWPEHLGAGKPYPENTDERVEDWLEWRARAGAGRRPAEARQADAVMERLASASGAHGGADGLAQALALRDAGRSDEAGTALAAWAGATKDTALLTWGRAVFAAHAGPLPRAPHDAGEYAVVAAAGMLERP